MSKPPPPRTMGRRGLLRGRGGRSSFPGPPPDDQDALEISAERPIEIVPPASAPVPEPELVLEASAPSEPSIEDEERREPELDDDEGEPEEPPFDHEEHAEHDDLDDEAHDAVRSIVPATPPAELSRFRRGLAVFVGFAGVVAVAFAIKVARSHGQAPKPPAPAPTVAEVTRTPEKPALRPEPPPPPPPVESSAMGSPKAVEAEPPAGDANALRDQALQLLKEMKNPEAMSAARAALDADPTDAMPYLVLGSALQDTGKWHEATKTYELCAKIAKRGMVDECRAMIRRK
jgi:hypothetical protein